MNGKSRNAAIARAEAKHEATLALTPEQEHFIRLFAWEFARVADYREKYRWCMVGTRTHPTRGTLTLTVEPYGKLSRTWKACLELSEGTWQHGIGETPAIAARGTVDGLLSDQAGLVAMLFILCTDEHHNQGRENETE